MSQPLNSHTSPALHNPKKNNEGIAVNLGYDGQAVRADKCAEMCL